MKKKKMNTRQLSLPILITLLVLMVSCAPATPEPVATLDATPLINTQPPDQEPVVVETGIPLAETSLPEPVSVATSRGPDLVATDPTTVNLASGQLQLVEFFRFT